MKTRILTYLFALALLLAPAGASAYSQGYYEGYYQPYYQGYYQGSYVSAKVSAPLVIGRQYSGGNYFDGYIDEVRISNIARWTGSNFTPPSSEYTSDANTVLLLHMDEDKASHYYSSAGGYFAEPPPSGFKAVSTNNLPAPAAVKPVSYFDAKAYTGNAGAPSYDQANKGSYITLSNNNYDATSATNSYWANNFVYSSQGFSSGKWYAEFKMSGAYAVFMGISDSRRQTPEATLGYYAGEYAYYPYGNLLRHGNVDIGGQPGESAGDTFMVAVDMNAGSIWFGKNGVWLGSGNPATGANPQYTGITAGTKYFAVNLLASAGTISANFGQSGRSGTSYYGAAGGYFTYAPPTGFQALPTTSSQDIGLVFKPDLVWIKNRTAAYAHVIVDAARGAGLNLFSNSNAPQNTSDTNGSVLSFNAPGFTAGGMCASATGTGNVTAAGNEYISWAWKKSPTAGFDIVTYSGDNSLNRLISHALGTAPDTILVKRIDAISDWFFNSQSVSPGFFSKLNTTDTGTSYGSPFAKDLIPVMNAGTTAGVTMTGSTESSPAWYAGNKNPNDYWDSSPGYPSAPGTPTPQWLRVDFGSSPQVVAAYSIKAYTSILYYYADQDFTFEGSNDASSCTSSGSTWTVLDTEKSVDWIIGEVKTFQVPQANQGSYRCYRLRFTKTSYYEAIVNELNLWAPANISNATQFSITSENGVSALNAVAYGADVLPTKTSNSSNGITMSGSVEYQPAYYAADKNNSSYWSTYSTYPNNGTPVWLRTDFIGSPQTLAAYAIRNYNSNNLYDPVDFTLQGSNDATTCTASGSSWTAVDTRTGVTWGSASEVKTFLIPVANQASYRCYRLYITKTSTLHEAIIAELNFFPATAGSSQYVAYLFANREGFQKSGYYYGNGSSNGPVVYTGFKPRFVMIKDTNRGDSNAQWVVLDSARSTTTTTADLKLAANSAVAENDSGTLGGGNYMSGNTFTTGSNVVEFLSNGFKVRSSNCATNCNQERFIYIAFAEVPFKTANTADTLSLPGSARFDQNVGAYLSRNNIYPGNRSTHTFSAWIKRGTLGSDQAFFTANTGSMNDSDFLEYKFNSNDQIVITGGSTVYRQTYDTFRDTTKWYHIVIAIDTTLPDDVTGADKNKRVRLYVDGKEIKVFWCVDHICQVQ